MNALIGEKLSITNPKAQTTRHRILGIWNDDEHQIVFSDTPGILDPAYKLQENMMSEVDAAIKDADAILYLVEPEEPFNHPFIEKLNNVSAPVIVVINKVDLNEQIDIAGKISEWKGLMLNAEIIPTSALHKFNVDGLINVLTGHLPEHPPYYDKEALTDRSVRFFVSEIIRENILRHFKKEIPYSVEVVVDAYKEGKFKDEIAAIIYVERESQKIIVIGQGGRAIKRLGTDSRRAIENFIRKKIRLDITVKVRKDWRSNEKDLKDFGYQN